MTSRESPKPVEHIAVIGGGRWARVIMGTLAELVSSDVDLSIRTTHSLQATQTWAKQHGLEERVSIASGYPEVINGLAVIVANAARDHGDAIAWAIDRGIPLLCEKPLTLSSAQTLALIERAAARKSAFYAGHVFLFSSSVQRFAALVRASDKPVAVRIRWVDPVVENRHGEQKRFDAGLPIYADWLPHILSILSTFMDTNSISLDHLSVARGGAQLTLRVMVDGVSTRIDMERNGEVRVRLIEVDAGGQSASLDFAQEPGTIKAPCSTSAQACQPAVASRPLQNMLQAFLAAAGGQEDDVRLSADLGLQTNMLIDAVAIECEQTLLPWTAQKCESRAIDSDLRYRLEEILQKDGPLPAELLDQRIAPLLGAGDLSGFSSKLFGGAA